ncbi:MAG: hypothetical protein AB7V32_02715 [Candidatus Berkiella sp.]
MMATQKKLLLLIGTGLASLLNHSAYAIWENNWLLGLSGGYAQRQGDIEFIVNHPLGQITSISHDQIDNGFIGGILGGYQARCHDWLFGGELNIEWQEVNRDQFYAFTDAINNGANAHSSYSQRNVVALTGRFGYEMYPNFMPYIRLGVQSSRDKLIFSAINTTMTEFIDTEAVRRVYRLTGGFGAEMPICYLTGLSARAEYNFRARAGSIEASELANDNATFVRASSRPKMHAFIFALVFNFV